MQKIMVGVDLEDNKRFEELKYDENKDFYEKVFTADEIAYCLRKNKPWQSFTARFCAKEAVIKALSKLIKLNPNEVEVVLKNRIPEVKLHKRFKQSVDISLSLSHTKELSIAFVIAVLK